MSANPQPRLLVTGDLDLLISRSLDGDLPGEEERELQSLIAADPAARARYEAMARVVGRLEALPELETPFAIATRINGQLEEDTKGFAASLHRFGFYFRPATIGVIAAGIAAVTISHTLMSPPNPDASAGGPAATVAEAPVDDGRVNVFFSGPPATMKDAAAASAAPPASAPARAAEPKAARRQEPVLVAAAETARAKEEDGFAPERDAPPPAAPAPPAAVSRDAAEASVARAETMQQSAGAEEKRLRAAAPEALGAVRPTGSVEVVGRASGVLRLEAPARLESLAGPFDGTYRLELDSSGRVTDVTRLAGGSGSEPGGLPDRLRALSFVPAEAARSAGAADVRVRLP